MNEEIRTAFDMVKTAWFQVLVRRELKQPSEAAHSRYTGMVKMADAVLELPERFEVDAQEAAGKQINDLHQRGYFSTARARLAGGGLILVDNPDP